MDLNKKQRFIGLFVLIALAAITVPTIFQLVTKSSSDSLAQNIPTEPEILDIEIAESFDDEIDLSSLDDFEMNVAESSTSEQEPTKQITKAPEPTKETVVAKTTEVPVAENKTDKTTTKVVAKKPKAPKAVKVAVAKSPEPKTTAKKQTKHVAKSTKTPLKKPENYAVQLGSFSQKKNATKLIEQLRKKGLAAYSKESTVNHKKITRVFVGPTTDTIKANEMIKRLNKEFHIKAIMVRHKV